MIARHIFNIVTLSLAAWFIAAWWLERTQRIKVTKWAEERVRFAGEPYEAQVSQLVEQSKGFYQMQEAEKNISLYLRDHYRDEITLGHHQGRTLDSIIIGYLSRERQFTKGAKTV